MKAKQFKELTTEELLNRQKELKEELFNLRFQRATSELGNPMRIKECKRDIARVMTVLRERELKAAK